MRKGSNQLPTRGAIPETEERREDEVARQIEESRVSTEIITEESGQDLRVKNIAEVDTINPEEMIRMINIGNIAVDRQETKGSRTIQNPTDTEKKKGVGIETIPESTGRRKTDARDASPVTKRCTLTSSKNELTSQTASPTNFGTASNGCKNQGLNMKMKSSRPLQPPSKTIQLQTSLIDWRMRKRGKRDWQ